MKRALALFALLALGVSVAQKPKVAIGTGSTGGVFFYYGTALADIPNKEGAAACDCYAPGLAVVLREAGPV